MKKLTSLLREKTLYKNMRLWRKKPESPRRTTLTFFDFFIEKEGVKINFIDCI